MAGSKRQRESDVIADDEEQLHPSRKLKTQYSSEHAQLAKIYNDLADDVQQLRLTAAVQLVKHVTADDDARQERTEAALVRLVKGVCSGRKAARLGFSIALAEVLRVAFANSILSVKEVLDQIHKLTQVLANVSGQERRDTLLGRRYALQAVLQSEIFCSRDVPAELAQAFVEAVSDLSAQRQWLRRECGAMVHEYLSTTGKQSKSKALSQALADEWQAKSMWKTPEGVAIWLVLSEDDDLKLPKHVWHKRNPFDKQERLVLAKVMQEIPVDEDRSGGGARQIVPSFAWTVVLRELTVRGKKDFSTFWTNVVDKGLFGETASNERKSLGLQVLGVGLSALPAWTFDHILSRDVLRCIMNHRAAEDRFLFAASKAALAQVVARSKAEPSISADLLRPLFSHVGAMLDQLSKTKTLESLAAQCDLVALKRLSILCGEQLREPVHDLEPGRADTERRLMADFMISTIRSHKTEVEFALPNDSARLPHWVFNMLNILASFSCGLADSVAMPEPAQALQVVMQTKVMAILAQLMTVSSAMALDGAEIVLSTLQKLDIMLPAPPSHGQSVLKIARAKLYDKKWARVAEDPSAASSLKLLLAMTIIQAYNGDEDAISVIEDTLLAVESRGTFQSNAVLVEIVLGYISRPSKVYKRLAEQVFSSFALTMTADTLESLFEILARKESLGGQQELFDDRQDVDMEDNGDDSEVADVEEDSDIEIVNGVVTKGDASDDGFDLDTSNSDSESPDEEDDDEPEGDEDEEAAFDRKLAEALGGAAMGSDDEDGSDMDDEQMMELEPHLTRVFKERKKSTSTKQDSKDARENIINFKSRILDLMTIFVKAAYQREAALELIIPLCELIRSTSSKMLSEKAFATLKQYFDACNKAKITPEAEDVETLLSLLRNIHKEALLDSSKIHANACSRSSLFIAKALVSADIANYQPVVQAYADLQSRWYTDPKSNLQSSMFTEFTSWSITTRKHR